MIISRTPLRISLMGGGSDLPSHYRQSGGAVVSTAIDKYVYITVNRSFGEQVRASYSATEIVEDAEHLAHPLIREALRATGIARAVEITSIADVHSRGTGLGSSSAYCVGLLHALWAYRGVFKSQRALAEEACAIELERLGEPAGKQDQYIAAHGGLQLIRFHPDETVFLEPIVCGRERKRVLEERLLLLYTGLARSASEILARQAAAAERNRAALAEMVRMAGEVAALLRDPQADLDGLGELMHRAWELKRTLAAGISTTELDELYAAARRAGALGGKLTGAGGGGFLLLIVRPETRARVRAALSQLRELPVRLEPQGSRIIFVEEP